MAMNTCAICGSEAYVVDSRREPEGHVRRRYHCVAEEKHRFITHEILREELPSLQEIDRLSRALSEALKMNERRRTRAAVAA